MKKSLALFSIALLLLFASFGCSQPDTFFLEKAEISFAADLDVKKVAEAHLPVNAAETEEQIQNTEILVEESAEEIIEEAKDTPPVVKPEKSESTIAKPNASKEEDSKPSKETSKEDMAPDPFFPEEDEEPIVYCEVCGKISDDGTNGTCIRRKDYICVVCGVETGWMECHTCGEKVVEEPWIPDQAEIDELYLEFKEYVLNLGCTWEDTMDPENGSWCGWFISNNGPHTSRTWIERNVKGEIKFLYEWDELTVFHVYIERINDTQWRFYILY